MKNSIDLDFSNYLAPNFNPHIKKGINGQIVGCCDRANWISCASAVLELITNIPANEIDGFVENPEEGWYAADMIKFLKKRGYVAIELNSDLITRPHGKPNWRKFFPIQKEHVLLINATLDRDDNSWFVVHNHNVYHHNHFQCTLLTYPLFFFNKVIQDTILVHHSKWNEKEKSNSLKPRLTASDMMSYRR